MWFRLPIFLCMYVLTRVHSAHMHVSKYMFVYRHRDAQHACMCTLEDSSGIGPHLPPHFRQGIFVACLGTILAGSYVSRGSPVCPSHLVIGSL